MAQTTAPLTVQRAAPTALPARPAPGGRLHEDQVGHALSLLRGGTSVNVVGLRSTGRSTFVRHAVEQLTAEGATVVQVRGVRALQDRPLGALAVAGIHISPAPGQLPALTSAVASLQSLVGSGGASVLVVDDADELDGTSAGCIVALQSQRRVPVLMTSLPRGRRQSRSGSLATDLAPAARITLEPLTFDAVHTYLHEMLPGAVDPTAVARIAAASGGLPGLVTALVEHGRRDNRLVVRDGLWSTRGELWTTTLAQVLEPMIVDLDDAQIDALTLLACAGTMPLATACQIVTHELMAELDERGLVQIRTAVDTAVVGVFPPLLGDYLTHEASTARTLLARERLTDLGLDSATRDIASESAGHAVIVQMLTNHMSALLALRRRDWAADPSAPNGSALVEAMLSAGSPPYEITSVLGATRVEDADDDDRATLATWAALLHASTGGTREDALAELDAARAAGCGADAALRAAEARVQLRVGDVPAARAALARTGSSPLPEQDLLRVAEAEVEVAAGRPGRALAALSSVTLTTGELRERTAVVSGIAALLECRLDDAVREAMAGVRRGHTALEPKTVLQHAYVAAYGLWLQGRVVELNTLVSSVLELGAAPAHLTHFQAALLTFAASGAHLRSQTTYARSVATQATALRSPRGPHPWMVSVIPSALLSNSADPEAAQALWDLATERLDRGFLAAGVAAGVQSLELDPRADRAAVLTEAAAGAESGLLVRLSRYGRALVSHDVEELTRQEQELRDSGLRQMAVRTAVTRSLELIDRGETADAIVHADTAWGQAGLRGRDLCGLFAPLDQAVNLTARERQVAVAVARGYTTPEIAAQMVLSVRTVENHIFSACRKVHADNREDLGRAARTWLTCVRR